MNQLEKFWNQSKKNKWLIVSGLIFALGDVLTTAIGVSLTSAEHELNPIWSFFYGQVGVTVTSGILMLAKYWGLCILVWISNKKESAFPVWFYVILHLILVIWNSTNLILYTILT